jgi:hypothetical protein
VLAPVTLAKRPHSYGRGLLAAPMAGRRTACAALTTAARQSRIRAKALPPVVIAFAIEHELGQRGLATLANELGPFEQVVIVDGRAGAPGQLKQQPDSAVSARWPRLGPVTLWTLPVRYAGSAVETVALADADSLANRLIHWIGGDQ